MSLKFLWLNSCLITILDLQDLTSSIIYCLRWKMMNYTRILLLISFCEELCGGTNVFIFVIEFFFCRCCQWCHRFVLTCWTPLCDKLVHIILIQKLFFFSYLSFPWVQAELTSRTKKIKSILIFDVNVNVQSLDILKK